MDEETIAQTKEMLAAHAHVVRGLACIEKMKAANVEARSQGQDDPYGAEAFAELEKEIATYAEQLSE